MRGVLRAGTQMEHGNKLGAGIGGQPEPQNLLGVAQLGCTARPTAAAEGGGYGSSAHAKSVHVRQHESERLVLVA